VRYGVLGLARCGEQGWYTWGPIKSTLSEEIVHLELLALLGGEELYAAATFLKIGIERSGIFVQRYISRSAIVNKSQFTLNSVVVIN
jgi:hypothetical protein